MFLWQMKLGRIRGRFESLFDDDVSEYGDIDNGNDSGEDEHKLSKNVTVGFILSAVQVSDDSTYKCEAKKQNQQQVIYFYMHVGK